MGFYTLYMCIYGVYGGYINLDFPSLSFLRILYIILYIYICVCVYTINKQIINTADLDHGFHYTFSSSGRLGAGSIAPVERFSVWNGRQRPPSRPWRTAKNTARRREGRSSHRPGLSQSWSIVPDQSQMTSDVLVNGKNSAHVLGSHFLVWRTVKSEYSMATSGT